MRAQGKRREKWKKDEEEDDEEEDEEGGEEEDGKKEEEDKEGEDDKERDEKKDKEEKGDHPALEGRKKGRGKIGKKEDGAKEDRRRTSFRDPNRQHQQHRGLLFFIPSQPIVLLAEGENVNPLWKRRVGRICSKYPY